MTKLPSPTQLSALRKMANGDYLRSFSGFHPYAWLLSYDQHIKYPTFKILLANGWITEGKPYGAVGGGKFLEHELTDAGRAVLVQNEERT